MKISIPNAGLPALEPLLCGGLWNDWASRNRVFPLADVRTAVSYVRLKPDTSCRLALFDGRPGTASDPPPGFLLYLFPDPARARQAWSKLADRSRLIGSEGFEAFVCEETAVVGIPFPNDPEVPGLRHIYRPYRLKEALLDTLGDYPRESWRISKRRTSLNLLAYKPGRRAVYSVETQLLRKPPGETVRLRLHLKVENPATSRRSFGNLVAIHDAVPCGSAWRVPSPYGVADSRSLVTTEWVDGVPLISLLLPRGDRSALRAVGRALAGLHRLEIDLEPSEDSMSGSALRGVAEYLSRLLPEEDRRIRNLGSRLGEWISGLAGLPVTVVHGDFHLEQVLLEAGRPVLVDFDGAGRGLAIHDLGTFLAHLAEMRIGQEAGEAFLQGYRDISGEPLDRQLVAVATAAALFRRAVIPFRRLVADWPTSIGQRLGEVEQLMEAAGA